jgi:MFS family permease
VAYVVFAFAGSVAVLLLSRLVQGVGGGTIGVVQAYVADVSPPEQRTKSLGWLSAVTSLGAVVGPAFGSILVGLGGQRAPGLAAAALSALVALFALRFLRESREPRASESHASPVTGRTALARVISHWHEPAPRLIWIYAVAIGAFYGTVQTVPLLLQERLGVTAGTVGGFITYLGGVGVLVRTLVLGRLVDRLGEPRVSRLGAVLLAAGLALTGLAHDGWVLLIAFTLMPVGTGLLFPCVTGLLSQVVSRGERGLYMGVQHTYGGVSRVVFPIAAGFLMDRFGVGVPFLVSGVLVLATLPLSATLARFVTVPEPDAIAARRVSAADVTGELPTEPGQ